MNRVSSSLLLASISLFCLSAFRLICCLCLSTSLINMVCAPKFCTVLMMKMPLCGLWEKYTYILNSISNTNIYGFRNDYININKNLWNTRYCVIILSLHV